jgi:hypothetical protein
MHIHTSNLFKRIYGVLLVAFLAGAAFAGPENQNVEGWRTTKWGMSPPQVLAALKGEAKALPKQESLGELVGLVEIPALQLEDETFEVKMYFAKPGFGLKKIVLNLAKKPKLPGQFFAKWERNLIEKYGQPDASSDDSQPALGPQAVVKKRSWKRGSTRIEFSMYSVPGGLFGTGISYEQIDAEVNKKL